MRQLELRGRIPPGAAVCDLEGHRVGTVARVHGAARARPAAGAGAAEEVVELRAGFLGRRHLYVPLNAVLDVDRDGVILGLRKSELEAGDWGTRPAHLDVGR
jgi:hypothetical protein